MCYLKCVYVFFILFNVKKSKKDLFSGLVRILFGRKNNVLSAVDTWS